MMTMSDEHESKSIVKDAIETWHETVAAARQERRQRGEPYAARHRRAAPDPVEADPETAQRSA